MVAVPRPAMRAVVRYAVRPVLGPTVPVQRQRRLLDLICKVSVKPSGTRTEAVTLGGRPAVRYTPADADQTRAVLYLHGGGYTVGSATTHGALAAHLAAAARAPVYLLDYRLAPEFPAPAALEDATAAYEELTTASEVSLVGDSAGGGLALALAVRIRDTSHPAPTAVALISPWVDLTVDDLEDSREDPMLRTAWLRACVDRYAGSSASDPEISPLLADLTGLPPLLVHGSAGEILLPDVERLVEKAREAGVPVRYRRLDGLWHVAHLHAGLMRDSTEAVADVGAFLAGESRGATRS